MMSGSNSAICREKYARSLRVTGQRPDIDTVQAHAYRCRVGCIGTRRRAPSDLAKQLVVIGIPEVLDARDDSNLMPSFGERFHQQPVRLVAAAV